MPTLDPVDGLPTAMIRVRMSAHDAHYGGHLVDGAKMLQLFGDVGTELSIRLDGDEGLFRAYDKVEFLAPVYAGDFIEVHGWPTNFNLADAAIRVGVVLFLLALLLRLRRHPR